MVLRASAGRGVRNPNLFIENLKYMPSYRNFVVMETILPEVAWNYGLNFTWNFKISPKLGGNLSIDLYRTDFENQLLADIDSDPTYTSIQFYNLKGRSYANSFLLSYTQDIVKGLEARIAYKFNDVWMTFGNVLQGHDLFVQFIGIQSILFSIGSQRFINSFEQFAATHFVICKPEGKSCHTVLFPIVICCQTS